MSGEDRIVSWLRRRAETGGLIGDDAAILPAGGPWAVTVDSQREGVHFPKGIGAAAIAHRLTAVNLSDLAATGARPRYAFVTLAAPPRFRTRDFFQAVLKQARRYGFLLAGGDLARSQTTEATLLFLGDRAPRGQFLARGSAQAGDELWVGGTLGEACLGVALLARGARLRGGRIVVPRSIPRSLQTAARRAVARALRPKPQLPLGNWLARKRRAVAAIDISDGLARDLHRVCRESKVGACVELDRVPRPPRFAELATELGIDPEEALLGGGDDYVLLFSLPRGSTAPPLAGCTRIGTFRNKKVMLLGSDGKPRQLPALGFDHFGG